MEIKSVFIENYRGIEKIVTIPLSKKMIPLVGVNESGKTTILEAIFAFDESNDNLNGGKHIKNLNNLYKVRRENIAKVTLELNISTTDILTKTVDAEMQRLCTDTSEKLQQLSKMLEEAEDENIDSSISNSLLSSINSVNKAAEKLLNKKQEQQLEFFDDYFTLFSQLFNNEEYKSLLDTLLEDEEELIDLDSLYSHLSQLQNIIEILSKVTFNDNFMISRMFPAGESASPYYVIDDLEEYQEILGDVYFRLIQSVLESLPQIVYLNEFTSLPAERINLDDEEEHWYTIYDRVFRTITREEEEIGLDDLMGLEETLRDTVLSRVQQKLSEQFRNAWKELTANKEKIDLSLKLESKLVRRKNDAGEEVTIQENFLRIAVVETDEKGIPSSFKLSSRSKGFIWYYNFIMNTYFIPNPKGIEKRTLFLLDEPGSYLHETSQKELLTNLKKQSNTDIVVYSTHSPALLNPNIVSPNNIQIVQKNGGDIIAENITNYTTKKEKSYALEPIYEALKHPIYSREMNKYNIVCVEGIYDMYFIDIFCNLDEKIRLFPSVSATTILKNISYFIAYGIEYICLWDNDAEGVKELKKANEYFGPYEAQKFATLNICGDKVTTMESILNKDDISMMLDKLHLDGTGNLKKDYQKILLKLKYETEDDVIQDIKSTLKDETRHRINKIESYIRSHFKSQSNALIVV